MVAKGKRIVMVRTKWNAFLIDYKRDELHARRKVLYGCCVHLYAKRDATGYSYSDYLMDRPVQVCNVSDVVGGRDANEIELAIYDRLASKKKLLKAQREYLQANFLEDATSKVN